MSFFLLDKGSISTCFPATAEGFYNIIFIHSLFAGGLKAEISKRATVYLGNNVFHHWVGRVH